MNPSVAAWKSDGGKVVGYFCSHVPVELLIAAGILPFRMRGTGSTGTELADAHFSSINCSFPRHTFNLALNGSYDFLDGLVCVSSCDHIRRVYDNWKRNLPTPFVRIMSLPKKVGDEQVAWYREEIDLLRRDLQQEFGVQISNERLREAIALHNETGAGSYRARLMIVGSELDDPAYIQAIEEQGGLVVTDSICYGTRTMWVDVDETATDPVDALARYYIQERPTCPRMNGDRPRRLEFLKEMVEQFDVDGIVGERMLFCDFWCAEHFMNKTDLKESGIPFLQLDREYVSSGVGQLRTRVQAFLETMGK
jgi:benzoyl-CoA reductase subunit C